MFLSMKAKFKIFRRCAIAVGSVSLCSCATPHSSITLSTAEPASSLSLVSIENPDEAGTSLTNPATLTSERMKGKAIRVSATGKAPAYWFLPSDNGQRVIIRVRNLNSCATATEKNPNRPVRLMLKAYQALTINDFALARDLCLKAAEIDPGLAGPYIIIGLSYYNEGKKQDARLSFNKARALDPEDQEIGQLLRMVE